jgi:hypothetical protein
MQKLFAKLTLSVIVFLFCACLVAQDSSSMTGVVTDPTEAVIPGTTVTLSNPSTGVTYTQVTNNLGSYRFMNVRPDPGYKVTFTHAGFATEVISDITLSVGVTRTQNAHLTVGGESQTVSVSAGTENVTLDTTDATVGNNIDVKQLNELPVYDRTNGIMALFSLQPGVDLNWDSVTGARVDQSEVTVDGLDANDISAGEKFDIVGTAPVDSVAQFTGAVAGLTSSTGTGSGGQFQLVTKNGTNNFHGNLNEYHRDTSTVANGWFNNLKKIARTPLIHNQFGADIGGPIKKDKLFFYFDWADSRIIQSSTAERTVPLSDFRNGNLNYINNGTGCTSYSRKDTTPSCISTLSSSQLKALDPAKIGMDTSLISYIASRYPTANVLTDGDGVNTGGYAFTEGTPDIQHTFVTRVDYNLTPTQKIYGRFTITRDDATSDLSMFNTDPMTHPYQNHSYGYVINHVWNIGKNKVNQFSYGDNIQKVSFPDTYNPTGAAQFSFSGLSGPYTSYDAQKRRVPIPVVRDDFNWQKGQHALNFGGTFKFIKTNSNLVDNFNFVGVGAAGDALGSGLDSNVRPSNILDDSKDANVSISDYDNLFATGLGVIGDIHSTFYYDAKGNALPQGTGAPKAYRYYQTELYVGDTWKATPKLTLSYGARYQYYSVPYETHGYQSEPENIDMNTFFSDRIAVGKAGDTSANGLPLYRYVLAGKANHGPSMYDPNYHDIAPRVAFAYSPFNSHKTVINGGAGIVYDRTVINAINFLQDQMSYLFNNDATKQFGSTGSGSTVVESSLVTDTRVGSNLSYPDSMNPVGKAISIPSTPFVDSNSFPYGLADGDSNLVLDRHLKDPYSISFNFGVQQELPAHMILKLNYVGRLGRRLLADVDANQVVDVPDYSGKSTQTMVQAFADMTVQTRAGANYTNITTEPWFENNLASNAGYSSKTQSVEKFASTYIKRGDISDAIQKLASYSYDYFNNTYWPTNMGIPSQFGTNAYLTNQGSSNYHGLLMTLDKNMSQGLRFQFNYTWSHSIDNGSHAANSNSVADNSGMICDEFQPRACRGSSEFDIRQEFTSDFLYALPIGRGKTFLPNISRRLDEAIGGWSISGLPSYRTGVAMTAYSGTYLASFDNMNPAIFTGSKADLKTKVNVNHTTNTVWSFAGGQTGANKVWSEFRGPIGLEYGQRSLLRSAGAFSLDAGLAKTFPVLIDKKVDLKFRADAYNVLNHPVFGGGGFNIVSNAAKFGAITGTNSSPRVAQFSLRLEF